MPSTPSKPCAHMGCRRLAIAGTNRCEQHARQYNKAADSRRERPDKHLYMSNRWKQLRLQQLHKEPLCAMCMSKGDITPATVVDHIKPHKGNWQAFHDMDNLQSLCKQCHDTKTATEDGGFGRG